ncbi:protein FAR1-RELATED SEQUENCE 5-like [Dioscorea cayenensis subsp. rotundata]|uniref:Protein FAR1-RELATED SEQUENCE 5-like n=1 Tax=Dioscorea cayennensis subsp. rotundata TaxID=55577 RepID=A0AB40BWT9_DIOCR|nr:protein FAR1-RELATED SEQUENCE 5-like [Dioscorea cayenensis subsp. rotundata]
MANINEIHNLGTEVWEIDELIYNAREFESEKENEDQPSEENEVQEQNEDQREDNNEYITDYQEDISLKPYVGMVFDSVDEACEFYNSYAYRKGFSVRKGAIRKSEKDGSIIGRRLYCSKEGYREERFKKNEANKKKHRGETRCGCNARLLVNKGIDGSWIVSMFVEEHNHILATPRKCHLLPSHRRIDESQRGLIDKMSQSGIRTNLMMKYFSEESQGSQNVGFIELDARNYLRTRRKLEFSVGDSQRLLDYMNSMQIKNPHFFYAIQLNVDGKLTSIFWCDARCRMDYSYFGDVICLDPTYGTNKYGMPFIPIILKKWNELLAKYDLKENDWMLRMYRKRQQWVPVYSRDYFCADMSTTQRSESINKFFKGFLSRKMMLMDFVQGVEKALIRRREKEIEADFKMNNVHPSLMLHMPIEEEASKLYTPAMFAKFQEELLGSLRYKCEKIEENEGLLCRHILKVFIVANVDNIPREYMLKRWTRDAKYGKVFDENDQYIEEDCQAHLTLRYSSLSHEASDIATKGSCSIEVYKVAMHWLRRTREEVEKAIKMQNIEIPNSNNGEGSSQQAITSTEVTIHDPPLAKCKGNGKRKKAFWEKNHKKRKSKVVDDGLKGLALNGQELLGQAMRVDLANDSVSYPPTMGKKINYY